MPPVDAADLGLGSNPVLQEVDEGPDGASGVEGLKAAHRRKRASKASGGRGKKKKRNADGSPSYAQPVLTVLLTAALILVVGHMSRRAAMDRKSNSCNMTYSRPSYVPLPVRGFSSEVDVFHEDGEVEYPGYGYRLLRYVDRKLAASDRDQPMKPGGIPVLFVPGHQGNYQQVRSLGSLASEMKISHPGARLDIFTLDFVEELSALHASMTWRQAEFLNHAVETILELYKGSQTSPYASTSVMIVGHSYGGLVARAAFTLPSYRLGSIGDIVTLGTPHNRAPWMMDYSIRSLYHCTDSLWRWLSPSPSTSLFSPCWTAKPAISSEAPVLVQGASVAVANEALSLLKDKNDAAHNACEAGTDESYALRAEDATQSDSTESLQVGSGSGTSDSDVIESEAAQPQTVRKKQKRKALERWGGYGAQGVDAEELLGNVILVGIAGGPEDLMLHPSLCVTDGLGLERQSVSYTTQVLEGCGFGVDHAALVWCKQLASRVVTALSELGNLKAAGVGAKDRTIRSSQALASSSRVSKRDDEKWAESVGFELAAEKGSTWVLVCRSVVTDRAYLVIPAWVLITGLVIAAVFIRGLAAKNAKDGQLIRPALMLLPAEHLHWQTAKTKAWSLWTYVYAEGWQAIAVFLFLVDRTAGRVCGYIVSALPVYAFPRWSSNASSFCGNSSICTSLSNAWRTFDGVVTAVLRFLNPFEGAEDALRLPPVKGLIAVYGVTLGYMMVFVSLVAVLGAIGSRFRRAAKKSPAPVASLTRMFESRRATTLAACVGVLAAHVEKFSLPPTFRNFTVEGELSIIFLGLSLSLYALLGSMAIFPASSSLGATLHQRLLVLIYAPVPALLLGPQLAAAGLLNGHAGSSYQSFVARSELAFASVAVMPMLLSAWLARSGKPFPSAPSILGFLAELQAQMEEDLARNNGGSVLYSNGSRRGVGSSNCAADLATEALDKPHGHSACGKCLHEDGGKGAVFVETDEGRVSVGAGVTLGPGFRVAACDCPKREPAAPSTWCEFCRCVCGACGGCKEAARAVRRSKSEAGSGSGRTVASGQIGPAGVVGFVSVSVLYVGLWAYGMKMMAEPCHCLWALATVGVVLCGMQWGLAKGPVF